MKPTRIMAALALGIMVSGPMLAQQTNEDARKQAKAEAQQQEQTDKQQKAADKQQAKADKETKKALGSKHARKAAKAQDKANATQPQ